MENSHTPGPWHVENETTVEGLLRTWIISKSGQDVITFAFLPEHAEAEPEQYALSQANAHLIASAPDLLAALQEIAALDPKICGNLEFAISKAKALLK